MADRPDDTKISAEGIAYLRRRLALAESVCVLYGWTGVQGSTEREKALLELWMMWSRFPGTDHSPEGNPELTDTLISDLARRRDETRAQTLARLLGMTTDEARRYVEQEGKPGARLPWEGGSDG